MENTFMFNEYLPLLPSCINNFLSVNDDIYFANVEVEIQSLSSISCLFLASAYHKFLSLSICNIM